MSDIVWEDGFVRSRYTIAKGHCHVRIHHNDYANHTDIIFISCSHKTTKRKKQCEILSINPVLVSMCLLVGVIMTYWIICLEYVCVRNVSIVLNGVMLTEWSIAAIARSQNVLIVTSTQIELN